jgi:hypothetical protein
VFDSLQFSLLLVGNDLHLVLHLLLLNPLELILLGNQIQFVLKFWAHVVFDGGTQVRPSVHMVEILHIDMAQHDRSLVVSGPGT